MSTRGAWGFRIGRKDKVTYNHSDSYPEGLGEGIVNFIKGCAKDSSAFNLQAKLAELAKGIELVDTEKPPTKAQIARVQKDFPEVIDLKVSEQKLTDWYCLTRGAQGNFEVFAKGFPYMSDSHNFLHESLFCEHAYIINLDEGVLEYHLGFNRNAKAPGRYVKGIKGEKCKGVMLLATYTFQRLIDTPTEEIVADMIDKKTLLDTMQNVA